MSAPFLGEFTPGKTIRRRFNTHQATGTPITLAGTPAVSVYKGSTTESTAGVTLTVDYDSRTGLHDVTIDTSADGTFYAAGSDFDIVLTAGTVDAISVVGTVIGTFALSNRAGLRPTVADRTLDVSAGGEAGLDWANVGSPTTTVGLTGTTFSTAQAVASVTDKAGFSLAAAGLDLIVVETGVNARQALAGALAAAAGVVSGQETGTVTIKGGNVATTRILAVCDSAGNRTAVTLTLPS